MTFFEDLGDAVVNLVNVRVDGLEGLLGILQGHVAGMSGVWTGFVSQLTSWYVSVLHSISDVVF
ncbi:MAG: hypothetical protein GY851_26770 [bacterium]|nr:hypothetical protein [bacterium]